MLKDWKKIQAPEEQELEKRLRDAREVLAKKQIEIKERNLPVLVVLEGKRTWKSNPQYGPSFF